MSLIVHYCRCDAGLTCKIHNSSLKLQESIKKRLEYVNQWLIDNNKHPADLHELYIINYSERIQLQSLIEDSEK